MALFACKARRSESTNYLQSEFEADDARAQTEHVAIVMLARLTGRVGIAAERSAYAAQLVCRHACPDAAAANDNSYLALAALHRASHHQRVIGIIVRVASIMRAEVVNLMARRAQFFNHALVKRKASMVCADSDSHKRRSYSESGEGRRKMNEVKLSG